jgi:cytochrome d ubiquinol oxidase subunit II
VTLPILWFCLIAFFWIGYLVLEGFDFGVGMLLPFLPRDERERVAMMETIGPFWDGNEVWLVVAAGATFAAFPAWYATMFSGFYLPLLLVLVLLIVRVVSFEWRQKRDGPRWRTTWLWANALGSFGIPFVWGIALANLVHGVPIDSNGDYAGGIGDLFSAYTIVGGLAFVSVFAFHGAGFLALRTTDALRERATSAARSLSLAAAGLAAVFTAWTVVVAVDRNDKDIFPPALPAGIAVVALVLAVVLVRRGRSGWGFAATAAAIVGIVATIFTSLYPRVLVSAPDFGNSLTVSDASSAHYTLQVITVAALVVTPLVLLYQGWTYYVFRARVTGEQATTPTA